MTDDIKDMVELVEMELIKKQGNAERCFGMDDKISVVITTYNDEKEIKDLLDDIFNQSHKPDEIVIADGGSKDNTLDIIQDEQSRSSIKIELITGKRLNISEGLNEAIRNSSYNLIAVMMTGNRYEANFLEILYEALGQEKMDVVYPPVYSENKTKFQITYSKVFMNGDNGTKVPSNHGVLIKRIVFEKIGLFYEKFIYAGEDTEFFNRARNINLTMVCVPETKVTWSSPKDIKSFFKERHNYVIAGLQIDDKEKIYYQYKNNIIILIILVGLCIWKNIPAICGTALLYILCVLLKSRKRGINALALERLKSWYDLFEVIKNFKYMKKEYHVDPKKIPTFQ